MTLTEPCLVKLEIFEGPLDLLLHLIKKDELNIYDIPIAMITEQYLEYLEMMKELNLEVAGDYLVIAAELGLIKSRMLLPRPEPAELEEEEDPRAELVRRLLEYQRYKDVAQRLLSLEILERDVFIRGYQEEDEPQKAELLRVDLWALIDAFGEIYKRRDYAWADYIQFEFETVTLDEKLSELVAELKLCKVLLFGDLFNENSSRFDVVITFLALLELVRNQVVGAFQDVPYAPIQLVYLGE